MGEVNKKDRARKAARWMGIVACVLVIGGAAWRLDAPAQQAGSGAGPMQASSGGGAAQPARTAVAAAAASAVTGQPSAAGPGRAASAASEPDSIDARQLAAIEAQWCSHGAQAHQQAMDALKAGHPRADSPPGGNWSDPTYRAANDRYYEARKALPTEQAHRAVEARLVKGWVDALLRRGDLQARATAHYLGATSTHLYSERERHARQLVELARSSTDPYLARLWWKLGRDCHRDTYCKGPPPGHWAAIEPANALAWLPEWDDKRPLSEAQLQGLARARYARAPGHVLQVLLLEQVAGLGEGMALDVALETIDHLGSVWHLDQTVMDLSRHCMNPTVAYRGVCLHAAGLYWEHSHPSLQDRALLFSLVRSLGAERDSPWEERLAALKRMDERELQVHMLDAQFGTGSERQPGCSALLAKRQRLRDQAEGGVWRAAQRLLGQL